MLIIGLNGSPQKEGNTVELLNVALKAAAAMGAKIELIHVTDALADARVPFCNNCTTPCAQVCYRDNSLGEAFQRLRNADGIIIGSPVYFGTVSGQLKGFWDKTRGLRREKAFINIVGGALSVGSQKFGGQETTVRAIQDMMLVQGMTVVGDGYVDDDAGHQGACAVKPAVDDANGMKRAQILGRRVAELAAATKILREQ